MIRYWLLTAVMGVCGLAASPAHSIAQDPGRARTEVIELALSGGTELIAAVSKFVGGSLIDSPGTLVSWNLPDGSVITLRTERVIEAGGARTWIGARPDRPSERSYVTVLGGHVVGTLRGEGAVIEFAPDPRGSTPWRKLEAGERTQALWLTPDFRQVPLKGGAADGAEKQALALGSGVAPTSATDIDVAVFYTPGLLARLGSVAAVHAQIAHLNAIANDTLANTAVNIVLRVVHREQVTYSDSNAVTSALDDFSGWRFSPFGEISPLPTLASTVRPKRDAVGADLMVLLRPYHHATHDGCGIGWVGTDANPLSFAQNFGYAVVSVGSDVAGSGYYCPDSAYMHELGHTMGLVHDRPIAPSPGSRPYAYGYGINYSGPTPELGDVMSYPDFDVPFFSSPNVRCNTATRTCTFGGAGVPLGVAGDPAPSATCSVNPSTCADGARALNEMRAFIASFRSTASPSISGTITQPGGAPLPGVTFCAVPSAGVSCTPSNGSGAYTCTVPPGWTGTLHSPRVGGLRIPPQRFSTGVTGAETRNVAAISDAAFACNLDIDDNGLVEPDRDGLAILRRLLGFPEAAFSGLAGACATRTAPSALFAAAATGSFAVTGASQTRAASDGLILIRAMRGATGSGVTGGVGFQPDATRTSWSGAGQIQDWLNTTCGYVHQPIP